MTLRETILAIVNVLLLMEDISGPLYFTRDIKCQDHMLYLAR